MIGIWNNNFYDAGYLSTTASIMEIITWKVRFKKLLHNHLDTIYTLKNIFIRPRVLKSITKVLACCTDALGFSTYSCPHYNYTKVVYFSCKSKLCNRCSKPATDKRLNRLLKRLPAYLNYYHITFTIPEELREFFLRFRHLWALSLLFTSVRITLLEFFR